MQNLLILNLKIKEMKHRVYLLAFMTFNTFVFGQFGAQQMGSDRVLSSQLDSIYQHDQKYRKEQSDIVKKYGSNSKEDLASAKKIKEVDAENQKQVSAILDKYGWPGPDVIGTRGSKALFMVLQHANTKMQEKYLPMMRAAVKLGKAKGTSLAMLEDRVLMEKGKKQIYGSQLYTDATGIYVCPIEDVDNLDKRRAEIGLSTMADYLSNWHITWNLEKYKNELPNSPAYKNMLAVQAELKAGKKKK